MFRGYIMNNSQASRRNLGSISAEFDERFHRHFVATPEFADLLSDQYMVVAGAKGSGKTAIMRALSDIDLYRDSYAAVYGVKFDGLKFGPLLKSIEMLNDASKQGEVAIARTTWQNVIAIFVLESVLQQKLVPKRERGEITNYLMTNGYLNAPASDKLIGHLERVWQLIVKLSSDEGANVEPLLGLHARQQKVVSAFPSDPKLDRLLSSALEGIRLSGKRVLICLDGLDTVVEYTLKSRDLIFSGMIDAIYKYATDPRLKDAIVVKALIPKEITHGARKLLRDLDKIDQFMSSVHWDADNLGVFIRRRLEEYIKTKNRSFEEVWREFFPEKVRNDTHGQDEDSYQYILRHTLFRPRQLLLHVQNILNEWDARSTHAPFKVDPTFIPKTVAKTNNKLAEYVVNELSLDFPRLDIFLKSLRGLPAVMPWAELKNRLERYFEVTADGINEVFSGLYNYGFFGVPLSQSKSDGKQVTGQFTFGFMTRTAEQDVAGYMEDSSLIALAPVFVEYCGCKPSPVGIISPCC